MVVEHEMEKEPAQIQDEDKKCQCRQSDNIFSNKSLLGHFKTCSGEKAHYCSHCAKDYSKRSSLILQPRTPTGKKP